jgi:hypothetical protein
MGIAMRNLAALLLLGCACSAVLAREPDLSASCVDARAMLHSVRVSPTLVTVATSDGAYRLDLAGHCETPAGAEVDLLAPDGWSCGGPREFLRSGDQLCRIARVQPIAFTEYTRLARAAAAAGATPGMAVLDPVQVIGRKSALRGFGGSSDYCFNPRFLRSWYEQGNAVVVETSPRRAGGNRRYRVELASACTDLDGALSLDFRSGVGIGLICANPGDRLIVQQTLAGQQPRAVGGLSDDLFQFHPRFHSRVSGVGCEITAVYPVRG